MAPYKDVKSLFDLASQSLGNYIGSITIYVLEKFHGQMKNENAEESRNLQVFIKETVEYYDTNIPPSLHNIVTFYSLTHIVSHFGTDTCFIDVKTREIFETDSLHSLDITTPGILDIAIRDHITKLNFSKWPYYIEGYLYKSLSRLQKLKLLGFSEFSLSQKSHFSTESEYIFTCIQSMKNLQSFVCPNCNNCNNAMLEMLSNNFTLENLVIGGPYYLSSDSVSSLLRMQSTSVSLLLQMQSLKTLQLSRRFTVDACKPIILGLPNLIYISYCRLNEVLAQITENVVLPLQYVEYHCDNQRDVTSLINLCPNIKKLYVSDISCAIDFSDLATLRNLTSLALYWSQGFYKGGIKFILEAQGYQITELEFITVDEISMMALYEISTLCPKLNTLILKELEVHEQPALPTENEMLFPNLEYLYCDIYENLNNSVLLRFLHNCINIKTVKFVNSQDIEEITKKGFTEEDFQGVLSHNHLEYLEELIFYADDLTVRSILELISSCKQLKRIGYLTDWCNITESEIQQLHQYVRDNNLDVEFLDYTYEDKEQVSVMKSSRHEFTVMTKFPRVEREFFVVKEEV